MVFSEYLEGPDGSPLVRHYLSEEALPGAAGVQETFPHQSHKLLPQKSPAGDLIRAFPIGEGQTLRLLAL